MRKTATLSTLFNKTLEKASDARNSDDGVLEVRLGAVTKQMAYYR